MEVNEETRKKIMSMLYQFRIGRPPTRNGTILKIREGGKRKLRGIEGKEAMVLENDGTFVSVEVEGNRYRVTWEDLVRPI